MSAEISKLTRLDLLARVPEEVLASRDSQAIADAFNVGRVRLVSRLIGERGVLDALGPIAGEAFLAALEAITSAEALPEPARPYFGALRRGVAWLKSEGLDLGSSTTRSLLDLLASVGVLDAAAVGTIKALARTPDAIDELTVRRLAWSDNGEWLL